MKFSKMGQLFLVSTIGLLGACLFTGCNLVTVDYIYLATSGATTGCAGGQIETFAVDSQSGAVRKAQPPVCSGGITPVALAVSPGYSNLYVANSGDSSVVHFAVADNGILTQKDKVTLSSSPVSLAVNAGGNELFVASGSGGVATLTVYSLSNGTIGSVTSQQTLTIPGFAGDSVVPTGVAVLPDGAAVYVTAYDSAAYNPGGPVTSAANPGWIFGFNVNSGAVAPTGGSPYKAGVKPTALAIDPTGRFVYVTDYASNQLIGYGVNSGEVLSFLLNGPFKSGFEPSSVAIDPRGKFMYVSNALDSTVTAYVIDLATGTPSVALNVTGSSTNNTDTQPASIAVEPALGRFVYTANYLGSSISGFRLDPTAGTLKQTQSTPYPTTDGASKPTALVAVPHGNHALQTVTP
jgi:6-phosphogluconolactonase (cycloisomerase 2 family)